MYKRQVASEQKHFLYFLNGVMYVERCLTAERSGRICHHCRFVLWDTHAVVIFLKNYLWCKLCWMYAFPMPLDLLPLEPQMLDPPVVIAAFWFCVNQRSGRCKDQAAPERTWKCWSPRVKPTDSSKQPFDLAAQLELHFRMNAFVFLVIMTGGKNLVRARENLRGQLTLTRNSWPVSGPRGFIENTEIFYETDPVCHFTVFLFGF